MMRKLEKQAMAQAAKEARKQQGKQLLSSRTLVQHPVVMLCASLICLCLPAIMAAEERRKKREQMKVLKQQVRIFLCVHCLIFRAKLHNDLQLLCSHSESVCAPR